MRRTLLAAACLLALSGRAHAQIPVTDVGVLFNSAQEVVNQVKSYALDLKTYILDETSGLHEAATDLNTAQTYLQEAQTYLALVQNPSLANAMGILGRVGLTNDMPINPMQVMSLTNGFNSMGNGGLMGDLAALRTINGYAIGALGQNHVYTCPATDQACTDLNARGNGIAGSMGITQAAYQDIQAHLATIQALRDDLAGETTPAKRETIQAQLLTEQVWMANMQASLASTGMQASMQAQSFQQRTLERQRASADDYFDGTQPITNTGSVVSQATVDAVPPLFTAN